MMNSPEASERVSWRSRKLSWSRRVGRAQVGTGEERSNPMEETRRQVQAFRLFAINQKRRERV